MIEISQQAKLFDLAEAKALLPTVAKITQGHYQNWLPIKLRLQKMLSNDPRRARLECEYESQVDQWRAKIKRVGALPVGLWVVDFDVGEGSLNWQFPELSLAFFRPNDAPRAGRIKLRDYIESHDPDWAI